MSNIKYVTLSAVCDYCSDRVSATSVTVNNYISTENMLPNKGGIEAADSVPELRTFSGYSAGDILLSNIRPYFQKIWFADRSGGCSNDVLVLRAKENTDAKFLYYVLSDNNFFNYDTVTSKGTKMPRGSKSAIMKYLVPDIDLPIQKRIADILSAYDDLIENNNRRIALLEKAARELYKEWFVRFRFPGYETAQFKDGLPSGWNIVNIGNLFEVTSSKRVYLSDYVEQLDAILTSGNRKLLEGPGKVSHEEAMKKAKTEYRKYQEITLSPVEEEYLKSIKGVEKEVKKRKRNTK